MSIFYFYFFIQKPNYLKINSQKFKKMRKITKINSKKKKNWILTFDVKKPLLLLIDVI